MTQPKLKWTRYFLDKRWWIALADGTEIGAGSETSARTSLAQLNKKHVVLAVNGETGMCQVRTPDDASAVTETPAGIRDIVDYFVFCEGMARRMLAKQAKLFAGIE